MSENASNVPEDEESTKSEPSSLELPSEELLDNLEQTISLSAAEEEALEMIEDDPSGGPPRPAGNSLEFSVDASATQPFGMGAEPTDDQTVANVEATIDLRSVQLRPTGESELPDAPRQSVMESSNLSQTINPRELSKEDIAFWGSVAQGASLANQEEQTRLKPAIERSISETNLQIRERDLAAPTRDPEASSDYRLIRLLGRGGMGNVYVAKQTSLDRVIAVKVIKPLPKAKRQKLRDAGRLETVENDRRQQFLSEAVVTSDLDHPNIVPIHDIAVASDDTLFYSMKRVVGEPWSKSVDEKSRDENLEILLKVCDAIAFAHTRGVVHRDIKPENVMLGNFGEVLVMDWGLALAQPDFEKKDSITVSAGLGGTPAFMAPEMAKGPVESIGPSSDVYLLGATLYYIVTGHAPHKAENVSLCVRACANNDIEAPLPEHEGELLDIAMRAMATDPADRFESVKQFQDAIRAYRSHSESIALATAAATEYERAIQTASYEAYSRATHGFEQAIGLWSENAAAIDGLARCKVDYAKAAHNNGDYDLGLSLLDEDDHRHVALIARIRSDAETRDQRAGRLKLFRFLAIAAAFIIIVGASVALVIIEQKRSEAERQRTLAEEQTGIAEAKTAEVEKRKSEIVRQRDEIQLARDEAKVEAENAKRQRADAIVARDEATRERDRADREAEAARQNADLAEKRKIVAEDALGEAKRQEQIAKDARDVAREAKDVALRRKAEAEYEYYLSQIGLAKARIDENEFDDARLILKRLESRKPAGVRPPWEWRWLWSQANQSESDLALGSPVIDLAVSVNEGFVISVCGDGSIHRSELSKGSLQPRPSWTQTGMEASAVAIDRRSGQIAIGNELGEVLLIRSDDGTVIDRVGSHESRTTDLAFLPDSRLVSASTDRTVALWRVPSRKRVDQCWHLTAVQGIAVETRNSGDGFTVVAAVGDDRGGRAVGWKIRGGEFERLGEFKQHRAPIGGIALSPDGKLAASGDRSGQVYVWAPEELQTTDYKSSINEAITQLDSEQQLVSARDRVPSVAGWKAHRDAVSALRFDDSGAVLLSGSDDYTIRVWNPRTRSLRNTLRGHGGWVRSLEFAGRMESGARRVVSGSVDGSVRIWDPSRVTDETLVAARSRIAATVREKQVHGDEILAARLGPSGRLAITASRDHTARILEIDRDSMSFKELARINTRKNVSGQLAEGSEFLAMSARVDEDGNRLFVGSADSILRIWDLETGTELASLRGTGLNTSFAISADGTRLLTGSSDPEAKAILWDIDRRRTKPLVLHRFGEHRQAVTAFALSSDGSVAITGDRAGRCLVWDTRTKQLLGAPIDDLRGFRINDIEFAVDDQSIWVASDNGALTEFGLQSRRPQRRLQHDGFVTSVSLSPNGRDAVTVSEVSTGDEFKSAVHLWNLRTERKTLLDEVVATTNRGHSRSANVARISAANFGDGGRTIVICRRDRSGRSGEVLLYDVATEEAREMSVPTSIGAPELGVLVGMNQLVTLNGEAAFRWDLDRMVHTKSFRPHAAVTAACFSPDGMVAATASRSVRFWDPETGQGIDKLETPHAGPITSLDFSSLIGTAGYLIATTGNDDAVRLWTWRGRETGFRLRRELSIDGTGMTQVRFSNDGLRVMGAGMDGRLRVWHLVRDQPAIERALPEPAEITCAEFSIDDRWLAVGTNRKVAWLFDLQDPAAEPIRFQGHADQIESIAIVQDGPEQVRLLTASRDKSIRVWDPRLTSVPSDADQPRTGREVLALRRHSGGVTSVDCTIDGDLVMTAARDGRVLLWPAAKTDAAAE
ncbi:MAG: protein kinase [Planctomycetota bacterium]